MAAHDHEVASIHGFSKEQINRLLEDSSECVLMWASIRIPGAVPNRSELKATNTYTNPQRRPCITPTSLGKYSAREGACPPAA